MSGAIDGRVGFFDLLGYRSFLVNNEPEGAAEKVLDVITESQKKIPEQLLQVYPAMQEHQSLLDDLRWLVISDTVLITSPQGKWPEGYLNSWLVFLLACTILQKDMFEFGLPMRGTITVGKYLVKQNCFAGKPIVDAYSIVQDLDLAATVFSSEAEQELRTFACKIPELTVDYLVPTTSAHDGNCERRYLTLNYFFRATPINGDITQMVLQSFWRHNKDISSDAARKARNTEQYLRYLSYQHESRG